MASTSTNFVSVRRLEEFKNLLTPTSIGAADSGHTHTGTQSTLTGYVKPQTGAAVASTDTLNAAIGKLEARIAALEAMIEYDDESGA